MIYKQYKTNLNNLQITNSYIHVCSFANHNKTLLHFIYLTSWCKWQWWRTWGGGGFVIDQCGHCWSGHCKVCIKFWQVTM